MGKVWHEPKTHTGALVFPSKEGGRVGVVFQGDVRVAPMEGHFMRYEGDGPNVKSIFPRWKKDPTGWFELWPHEPLLATSSNDARAKIAPLLPLVENGSIDDQFEKRPYIPPMRPVRVKEIEHPTAMARAVISKHPDGLCEAVTSSTHRMGGTFRHPLPASAPIWNRNGA